VTAGTAASGTKARVPISRTSSGARRAATACATSRASNGPPRKIGRCSRGPARRVPSTHDPQGGRGLEWGSLYLLVNANRHSRRLPPALSTPHFRGGNSEGPGPLPLGMRSGSFVVCGSGLLDHDGDVRGHLVV